MMSNNRPRWKPPAPCAWSLGLGGATRSSEAGDIVLPGLPGGVGRVCGVPMPEAPTGVEKADRDVIAIMSLKMNHIPEQLVNWTCPVTHPRW